MIFGFFNERITYGGEADISYMRELTLCHAEGETQYLQNEVNVSCVAELIPPFLYSCIIVLGSEG